MGQKVERSEVLFYVAWILFLISMLMETTALCERSVTNVLPFVLKIMRYGAYLICCLKIMLTDLEKRSFWGICFMMGIFLFSFFGSSNQTMLLYSFIMLAAISVDGYKIIRVTTVTQGFFLTIIVLLSQVGILEDYLFVRDAGHYRHGLGFSWTTTSAIIYFYFILGYIYVKQEKLKILHVIILEAFNYWLYRMTDSRMAFLISSIFVVFFAFQSINRKRWKFLSKFNRIYILVPIILFVFCIILFLNYNEINPMFIKLNELLSDRLSLGSSAIQKYGFSLFGQKIEWVGYSINTPTKVDAVGYNYVDSSYLQLALNYGIFFVITILVIYMYAIYKAIRIKNYYLVAIYMAVLLFSMTEPRLMNLTFNPFPLFAFAQLNE